MNISDMFIAYLTTGNARIARNYLASYLSNSSTQFITIASEISNRERDVAGTLLKESLRLLSPKKAPISCC